VTDQNPKTIKAVQTCREWRKVNAKDIEDHSPLL